ncbi:MAG: NAD(P)-binding protein [bacterium]
MPKVQIVGAGLSGMVAAIHLAREGDEVTVLEGHSGIGGLKHVHPSCHSTPIHVEAVSHYTGIDLAPCFKPIRSFQMGVQDALFSCRTDTLYCVERGDRPTAIDMYLYQECLRHGVRFVFDTLVRDPFDLPPDSIIATGLHREMFDAMEIPYETVYSFWMCAERNEEVFGSLKAEFEQLLVSYMDDYTNDYFYATAMNRLWYALLFSRKPLSKGNLDDCVGKIRERLGVELKSWRFLTGAVPTKSARNPRLFMGDKILAGSLSGSMDPMFLFGIHGALLSGKIAATAVRDPRGAEREFQRINRNYVRTLIRRRMYERNRFRNSIQKQLLRWFPRAMCRLSRHAVEGVPGYSPVEPMMSSIRRMRPAA